MDSQHFNDLVGKYLSGTATAAERRVVEAFYEDLSSQDPVNLSLEQKDELKKEIYWSIHQKIKVKSKIIPIWRRIAAAAIFLFTISGIAYFLHYKEQSSHDLAALPQVQRFKNDVVPARNGVTLILADGSKIRLDSVANGKLASQGKTIVLKQDSTLAYESKSKTETVLYNTVSTAKGQDFHIHLADGTEVWLDAMSSIHFPTSFTGNERRVEISGQVYFEVNKNPSKPFRVQSGSQTVEVLGTHFNINAYEPIIKTTLLEGSVKIVTNQSVITLAPGQQALLNESGALSQNTSVDIEETMAWKNGRFHFDGASVNEIMNQISRWYDIDVVYQDKIPEEFVAKISRGLPVSKLLNLLEMTGQVAFTIDGNKVTVLKAKH
jgi:transmembrane sensor